MKRLLPAVILFILASVAVATPIKTWYSGDIITASDLNGALGHIHNLMVGGHGPRLINSDVAGNAAISFSKLQGGGVSIPVAWGRIQCISTCAAWDSQSGFVGGSTGNITSGVTLTLAKICTSAPVVIASSQSSYPCWAFGIAPSTITITCSNSSTVNVVVYCQ